MKKLTLAVLLALSFCANAKGSYDVEKSQDKTVKEDEPKRCSFREKNCFGRESVVTRKLRRFR